MHRRAAERIRRLYDRNPGGYDRGMSLTERLVGRGRRRVGEEVRGRVLDIGFGTGLSLPHYPASVSVVGVDLSPGMLARARSRASELGRRAVLLRMDAERLAFADQVFDSVACSLCLCTVPDPLAAVREAVRVARPGAPMVFLEHVRSHLWPVAALLDAVSLLTVPLASDHFNRRTAEVVAQGGVEVLGVERWLLGFFNLIRGRAPG